MLNLVVSLYFGVIVKVSYYFESCLIMNDDIKNAKKMRDLLVARLLVTLISAVIIGLGIFSIVTEHYYGYTSKYGGQEVILDGIPAIKFGLGYILLGMSPLALWAKSGKAAGTWAAICLISGLIIILFF